MPCSNEGEGDSFFDSVDFSEESEYNIWLNKPQSVKERRQSFLCRMGLGEFIYKRDVSAGLDRITECSGAVISSSVSCPNGEEGNFVSCSVAREGNFEANSIVDDMNNHQMDKLNGAYENENPGPSLVMQGYEQYEGEEGRNFDARMSKMKSWWKHFVKKRKKRRGTCLSGVSKLDTEAIKTNRINVKQNKKQYMEFTGLYMGQEFQAHSGFIWTVKFSPDGQYLATGGEDKIVRIWSVTSVDASHKSFMSEEGKSSFRSKKTAYSFIITPDKVFHIEEAPLQEFHGHSSDILDLTWSDSNHLLSSSMDKTVRLWQVGFNHCLNVFHHNNYVTCIQFNPIDKNYFISGSIDGKVRIWGVYEKRVVHWADVRDVISAIGYQPNGKGFVVGTITGSCRFYDASGNDLQLKAEIRTHGRKRNSGNRITSIQFSQEAVPKLMITSEDSKLRIFDGVDIVNKFKGLPKSGSQMSASFTSNGRHIISVGEDCCIYVWNYDRSSTPWSKHVKSVRSCEYFFYEGLSVAVPWSGTGNGTKPRGSSSCSIRRSHVQLEENASWSKGFEHFPLSNWLFIDGRYRESSITWLEEKLPSWDLTVQEAEYQNQHSEDLHQQQCINADDLNALAETWGLVIVTAGRDGKIRTFHNYGLPIRLK